MDVDVHERARRRAAAVPLVSRIARSRDFRNSLAEASGGSQSHTIIPVLADDTLSYVHDRLKDAGGTALVALLEDKGLRMAVFFPASPARLEVAGEDDDVLPIHEDITISFVLDALRDRRGAVMVIERVAAKMLEDDCDFQPA